MRPDQESFFNIPHSSKWSAPPCGIPKIKRLIKSGNNCKWMGHPALIVPNTAKGRKTNKLKMINPREYFLGRIFTAVGVTGTGLHSMHFMIDPLAKHATGTALVVQTN